MASGAAAESVGRRSERGGGEETRAFAFRPGVPSAELIRGLQSNTEYILMSGSAKLVSIGITYPYQVIRSRIQVRRSLCASLDTTNGFARSTNPLRYPLTPQYPTASREPTPRKACWGSTKVSRRTR